MNWIIGGAIFLIFYGIYKGASIEIIALAVGITIVGGIISYILRKSDE